MARRMNQLGQRALVDPGQIQRLQAAGNHFPANRTGGQQARLGILIEMISQCCQIGVCQPV